MRTKLFFDFWNFQLHWNDFVGKAASGKPIRIPWQETLQKVVLTALREKRGENVSYAGTHVYASIDPGGDEALRRFLHRMDSFPGYSVLVKERKRATRPIRCTACNEEFEICPKCQRKLRRTVEKGVDVALLTDMIQMAYDNVYDIAVLGSSDSDLCQGVRFIQERIGKQIYHLWYTGVGISLRNACWDHIPLSNLLDDLGVPSPE